MDLTGFQREELSSPIQVADSEETTVEGALNALNDKKANIFYGTKEEYEALPLAVREQYEYLANENGEAGAKDVYSTSETKTNKVWIDGKPIYRKVVDFGALPNATNKLVNHDIANLDRAVSIYGQAQSSSGNLHPLPYASPTASQSIELYAGTIGVVIVTGSDRSNLTGYVVIEYTKTTDG